MALDPESQRLLDLAAAANRPAWTSLSPEAAREQYLSLRPPAQGPRPAGVAVSDRTIPGPAGALPIRIYRPATAAAELLTELLRTPSSPFSLGAREVGP
jgi:acetyl esterase